MGMGGRLRIFTGLVHARSHESRIWVERDGTAEGLTTQLPAAGVPAGAIVLAFPSAWKRAYTDFAAVSCTTTPKRARAAGEGYPFCPGTR